MKCDASERRIRLQNWSPTVQPSSHAPIQTNFPLQIRVTIQCTDNKSRQCLSFTLTSIRTSCISTFLAFLSRDEKRLLLSRPVRCVCVLSTENDTELDKRNLRKKNRIEKQYRIDRKNSWFGSWSGTCFVVRIWTKQKKNNISFLSFCGKSVNC